MNRAQASEHVSYSVDAAGRPRELHETPKNARLVGWQCGFEPLFVAVWSHPIGYVPLTDEEAEEVARDFLQEKAWFADNDNPPPADYIL